ncbi:MAG: hypothetical protein FWE27_02515 [Defluviitaleaceae bacterium]|nr:hypothetical protein [Defluviitaleaceae bacterium]
MKKWFLSFAVMALALSVMLSTVAFASEPRDSGRITAKVDGVPTLVGTQADRTELLARIVYAEARFGETDPSVDGTDVATNRYWATDEVMNLFKAAINAAKVAVTNIPVAPGVEFDITIGIEGNTGFAGMIMQLGFPTEIEVRGFSDFSDDYDPLAGGNFNEGLDFDAGFTAPINDAGGIEIARTADGYNFLHTGWAGRTEDFEGNGNLFTFTVRVASGTTPGFLNKPITIAIANAIPPHNENPTGADMVPLRIELPCGTVGGGLVAGAIGQIGHITVVAPTTP